MIVSNVIDAFDYEKASVWFCNQQVQTASEIFHTSNDWQSEESFISTGFSVVESIPTFAS